jgi:hypothetical protein
MQRILAYSSTRRAAVRLGLSDARKGTPERTSPELMAVLLPGVSVSEDARREIHECYRAIFEPMSRSGRRP